MQSKSDIVKSQIVNCMSVHVQNSRMTTTRLRKMKQEGEKIAMLTSYDFTLTRLLDEAGIEMILVGDSASNIVCGNRYTLPITVEEMIFLTKGVVRAAEHALVVIDMPFGSYQVSEEHPTFSSCHPLLLLPSIFPSIRVFSNELALHVR